MTLEAMGWHKAIARAIVQQDAEDVWALQETHQARSEDVRRFGHDGNAKNRGPIASQGEETVEAEPGRLDLCTDGITSDLEGLGAKAS